MKGSTRELFQEENICWEKGTFNVLGIKFSIDFSDTMKINYNDKIREIKILLTQWIKIILNQYGKITVIYF